MFFQTPYTNQIYEKRKAVEKMCHKFLSAESILPMVLSFVDGAFFARVDLSCS